MLTYKLNVALSVVPFGAMAVPPAEGKKRASARKRLQLRDSRAAGQAYECATSACPARTVPVGFQYFLRYSPMSKSKGSFPKRRAV